MFRDIIRCTQHDLLNTGAKTGQLYFLTDMRVLYKDNGNSKESRMRFNAIILNTDYERLNSIKPVIGKFYYIDETNSLWLYDTKWVLKVGQQQEYNTYVYGGNHVSPVVNRDEYITGKYGDKIIDNNGLLGDGSVVIRDNNRMTQSYLKANDVTRMIEIKSYLDNGFLFIPNSHLPYSDLSTSLGALHLTVEKQENTLNSLDLKGNAYYYGDWNNNGNIYIITKVDSNVDIDYIPNNNKEVVKFKIECTTTDESGKKKTYIIIRPISDSSAMVQLVSLYNENLNSAITNDLGELLFPNTQDISENIFFECSRIIRNSNGNKVCTYVFDNYNESITFTQNISSNTFNISLPELWCQDDNYTYESMRWVKDKVLTSVQIESYVNDYLSDKTLEIKESIKEYINNLISNNTHV